MEWAFLAQLNRKGWCIDQKFGPFWDLGAKRVLSRRKHTERQRVGREFSY